MELKNSIDIQYSNRNEIYVNPRAIPINDEALPIIKKTVKKKLKELGIPTDQKIDYLNKSVSDEVTELFKVRYSLEESIRILGRVMGITDKGFPTFGIINELIKNELLSGKVANGVREIIAICNNAIHGEEYTKAQLEFVRETAPSILFALENEIIHYTNS